MNPSATPSTTSTAVTASGGNSGTVYIIYPSSTGESILLDVVRARNIANNEKVTPLSPRFTQAPPHPPRPWLSRQTTCQEKSTSTSQPVVPSSLTKTSSYRWMATAVTNPTTVLASSPTVLALGTTRRRCAPHPAQRATSHSISTTAAICGQHPVNIPLERRRVSLIPLRRARILNGTLARRCLLTKPTTPCQLALSTRTITSLARVHLHLAQRRRSQSSTLVPTSGAWASICLRLVLGWCAVS